MKGRDVIVVFNITEKDDNVGNCEKIIGTEAIIVG
jgi:hypothetical protein